ncbi:hypothetical protein [Georgenia muralis]|uniref:Uncharacterized protein n=1 Tax=Georgenia muralis TaxID=154117 RepID=A0A3N4Z0G7_9MICO|nr:hypothetical protein [Georgenia muralis]RPF26073.1 hypothetical protein EDD32_0497 [Georgenia muralis]
MDAHGEAPAAPGRGPGRRLTAAVVVLLVVVIAIVVAVVGRGAGDTGEVQVVGATAAGDGTAAAEDPAADAGTAAGPSSRGAPTAGPPAGTDPPGTEPPGTEPPGTDEPADADRPGPDQPAEGTAPGSAGLDGPPVGDDEESQPQPAPALPRLELPSVPPASAAAEGSLVAGFPESIVPVLVDATVRSSSVAAEDDRIQVTLVATTEAPAQEVVDEYWAAFGAQGFAQSPRPAVPGTEAHAFTRDRHALLLSVRPNGSGTVFTVAGVLVTG